MHLSNKSHYSYFNVKHPKHKNKYVYIKHSMYKNVCGYIQQIFLQAASKERKKIILTLNEIKIKITKNKKNIFKISFNMTLLKQLYKQS